MELDSTLFGGLVGGLAALVAARHVAKSASRDKRAEFAINTSEKMRASKLSLYAEAFAITGKLSKHLILVKDVPLPRQYFDGVKAELVSWESKCGPIFSDDTLKAFRALLEDLSAAPKQDGTMSRQTKNEIWRKRAWFRGCLKAELSEADRILEQFNEDQAI